MDNKTIDKIGVVYCICQCPFFEEAFGMIDISMTESLKEEEYEK